MSTPVTIHGGNGSDTINFAFTVTGTNTTYYASNYETLVNKILTTGTLTPLNANAGLALGIGDAQSSPVYDIKPSTVSGGGFPSYTVPTAGYVLDTISSANITLDNNGGDTVLVAAINSQADVVGNGGSNQIIFVTGENVFDGSADTGGDTAVAGSGKDTIYTSLMGSSTVYSGTGQATIVLQDTTTGVGINDLVYLQDGSNTVFASGMYDGVIATLENQTIYGYTSDAGTMQAGSTLVAVLLPNSDGSASGNDLVVGAGSATVDAFDYGSGNTIEGGLGTLYFIAGDSISASVTSGAGSSYLFGASADTITLTSGAGDTAATFFVAGAGNESLNGAASGAQMFLYGGTDTAGGDTLIGGSYANVLTAGAGTDSLVGGSGAVNYFQIAESASGGANITITDFGTTGTLLLDGGFTQADAQALYNDTVTSGGNLVATIGSSTNVTFTGITSGSQLQGHIVVFSS